MTRRMWGWIGLAVTVVAVSSLGIYFAAVGLDKANKVAGVVGALVAVVGLAVAVFGLLKAPGGRRVEQRASASDRGQVSQVGGNRTVPGTGSGPQSSSPGRVSQDAQATQDGSISQVGGDQDVPGSP